MYRPMIGLVTLFFTLSSCNGGNDIVKLTQEDSGNTVELQTGQTLAIVLDDNPTTGYVWEMHTPLLGLLDQVGEAEFEPDSQDIGAGGKITLRFKAVASGEGTLRLIYRRPWEQEMEPPGSFEVIVVVK